LDLNGKVGLVRSLSTSKELPVSTGAKLLGISRTSIYYKGAPVSEAELRAKSIIDVLHTKHPTWGARQMSERLKKHGLKVGRKKARRYMNEMAIDPIYPKPNLSKAAKENKVYPYLLRHADITAANQAWSIDITYIRLDHGFVYLTAIIDWHSRCIVGWDIDDTLGTQMVLRALRKAFAVSSPRILNSDQGSQFTSKEYVDYVTANKVQISMDGKGRWADNIPIERWFRTLKYEEGYLKQYCNMRDARKQIGEFIHSYNHERLHSSVGYQTPASMYYPIQLLDAAA
jgi:putative transposase